MRLVEQLTLPTADLRDPKPYSGRSPKMEELLFWRACQRRFLMSGIGWKLRGMRAMKAEGGEICLV